MARCVSRVAAISYMTAVHNRGALLPAPTNTLKSYDDSFVEQLPNGDLSCGDKPEETKKFLSDVVNRIDGLYAITITDRDGIPIVRVASEKMPDSDSKPNFLATVSLAVDQAGKLGIGKNKRIICMFTNFQVVHFNKCPLMISLIASIKANTGLLLNLESELSSLMEDLRVAVDAM